MIHETNKNFYPLAENKKSKKEDFIPVLDTKGKVLKIKSNDYSKVESNPFESSIKWNRVKNYYSHKSFEYDFTETNRIIDTEALVSAVFRRKKHLILKEDPILKSENSKNLDYINKRLLEIEYVSEVTFSDLLDSATQSLISYHNTFILKNRSFVSSSGNKVDKKDPIASLHILSPSRLTPIEDELGDLIGYNYKSKRSGKYLQIPKDMVYHIHTDKKIDVSVGTPPLEAVKDDILSLRQIEESIERLIYKNASPLLHVQVGTDDLPAQILPNGDSEIDYYNSLVYNMEDEGGLTTSHRVKINLLGSESQALRIKEYAEYFKGRVLAGLKASSLDIGEANSISTAGATYISDVLKQDVISYQKIIERFFTEKLFNDLLLEADWYKNSVRVERKDSVQLKLLDSNIDAKIKYESHLANLVRFGLMDREEFGRETGRKLPPIQFTEEQLSGNISNSNQNGTFTTVTSPQNQNTEATDVEYQVLDEIVSESEHKKSFFKMYFYIEDNFKDVLKETISIEDLTKDLVLLVSKYKDSGLEIRSISKIINSMLEETILNNLKV